MKVYLIDSDPKKAEVLSKYFGELPDVTIVNQDFETFITTTPVQCVVSPGNSFGLMDGGYDAAITSWYGKQLMYRVQQYIKDNFAGEQTVGTSFAIDTKIDCQLLIHTPTMRVPKRLRDASVIYQCMRSTLLEAKKCEVQSILIPAFGAGTGEIEIHTAAVLMKRAYEDYDNVPEKIDWAYANKYGF